jgi:tRNA uridine 5-carbamoylmethylation protein Kti12
MPTLHMLIGPPCSGKTTWVKEYKALLEEQDSWYEPPEGPTILSTDNFLDRIAEAKDITYTEAFDHFYKNAEEHMWETLNDHLNRDPDEYGWSDIIWDQTNLSRKSRAKKLLRFKGQDKFWYWRFEAHVFYPPIRTVLERLEVRNQGPKFIPPDVVNKMYYNYEEPTLSEGFHAIFKEA